MSKILLIGGTPCAGKTTLAKAVSQKLNIPWISTDIIRSLMQKFCSQEDSPNLFDAFDITPEKYFETYSATDTVNHQNMESEEVWKGVLSLIKDHYPWKNFIIEGIAIMPKQVAVLENPDIKSMFIVSSNDERLKEGIWKRGLWDAATNYPDYIKDIELNWVKEFNSWIIAEANKYQLPYFEWTTEPEMLKTALALYDK